MTLADRPRLRIVLRIAGSVAVVIGGILAIWLVFTGKTVKTLQLGGILGLWVALLAPATLYGTRAPRAGLTGVGVDVAVLNEAVATAIAMSRPSVEAAARQATLGFAQRAVEAAAKTVSGRDLEPRRPTELEREQDESTRREFALSLEAMLRREMERVFSEELQALRQEVSELRSDLVEQGPGRVRLERTETTRLIGSDLESLHHEVRRFGGDRGPLGEPMPSLLSNLARPGPVGAMSTSAGATSDASAFPGSTGSTSIGIVSSGVGASGLDAAGGAGGAPEFGEPQLGNPGNGTSPIQAPGYPPLTTSPAWSSSLAAVSTPESAAQRAVRPATVRPADPVQDGETAPIIELFSSRDPFAELPRLSPFVDDSPPQSVRPTASDPAPAWGPDPSPNTTAIDRGNYVGRRRGSVPAAPGVRPAGADRRPVPERSPASPGVQVQGAHVQGVRGVPQPAAAPQRPVELMRSGETAGAAADQLAHDSVVNPTEVLPDLPSVRPDIPAVRPDVPVPRPDLSARSGSGSGSGGRRHGRADEKRALSHGSAPGAHGYSSNNDEDVLGRLLGR